MERSAGRRFSPLFTPRPLPMDIISAIKTRKSVRNYLPEPLTPVEADAISASIASAVNPFGARPDIRLRRFDIKGSHKPGTYGVISGAGDYLLMASGSSATDALAAGFVMEQVVLAATALGLATCWIGGTFRGSQFGRGEEWPSGSDLRIIVAVGNGAPSERMLGKLTKLIGRSTTRKPFDSLFFTDSFSAPLPDGSRWREPLEMMRLAPSSRNSQPWRACATDSTVHFYSTSAAYMSMIDCGIALSHFYLTATRSGIDGRFGSSESAPSAPSGWVYVTSFLPL